MSEALSPEQLRQYGEEGFLLASGSDPQEKNSSAYSLDALWTLVRTRSRGSRVLIFADMRRLATWQTSPNQINSVAKATRSTSHQRPSPRAAIVSTT